MKATISKQLSEGEVLVLEIEAKNPEEMASRLASSWPVIEQRPRILIERIKDTHAIVSTFPAEVQQAVHASLGLLFGKSGMTEQLKMCKEVIDRNTRDLVRLKATYEPDAEPAPTLPTVSEGHLQAAVDGSEPKQDLAYIDAMTNGNPCAVCGAPPFGGHDANAHKEALRASP